ncbi:hypothetical protein BDV25DRAFT_143831 [Aspergillus avenaceus]|uniref:MYND-type domain-containing protein n=1 Tax=Aspergillus avenaceus TaxID=36643 RepID=A0A5N6TIZ4_ASPAV|nr:hypothetical protein BDV25DRAFT_143831 [Aspergillus avenaceus]
MDSPCSWCHQPAHKPCTACQGAPAYENDAPEVIYCSSKCQKDHWRTHKPDCQQRQTRISLRRAAVLIKDIFRKMRLHAYPWRFAEVVVAEPGKQVFLNGFESNASMFVPLLRAFPVDLVVAGDQELRDAVLMFRGCADAMLFLYEFVEEIREHIAFEVEEITCKVINPRLNITLQLAEDHNNVANVDSHNVYRVTLRNGEQWVIDPTGAQFGFPDPLCTWQALESNHVDMIHAENPLGSTRSFVRHLEGMYRRGTEICSLKEELDLMKALEMRVPLLFQVFGTDLFMTLQGGSDAEFDQAKEEFLGFVERCFRAALVEINSIQSILRRRVDTERLISQLRREV